MISISITNITILSISIIMIMITNSIINITILSISITNITMISISIIMIITSISIRTILMIDHQVESKEDASDAVRKVNGQNFNGGRIRVELANACSDSDPRDSGSRAR